MSSFTSPLYWQIHNLVTSITKKNFKGSRAELNQLVELYGPDARQFLVQCLIEETHFRDQRGHQQKDNNKLQLLTQEIQLVANRPNFATIICQVLDTPRAHSRDARTRGAVKAVTDEFLTQFCKTCKLPIAQQLAIGVALCDSAAQDAAQEAHKFLRSRWSDVVAAPAEARALDPHLGHRLLFLLKTKPQLQSSASEVAALRSLLLEATAKESLSVQPVGQDDTAPDGSAPGGALLGADMVLASDVAEHDAMLSNLQREVLSACSLADLMQDLGYACTKTPAAFRELLAEFLGTSAGGRLREIEVARMLSMMARTRSGLQDHNSALACGSFLPDCNGEYLKAPDEEADAKAADAGATWGIDVVAQVLSEDHSSLNWRQVAQELDHATFHIENEAALRLVVTTFRKASRVVFPIDVLFRCWRNTAGQLSFLRHAVSADPSLLSFSASAHKQDVFAEDNVSNGPANEAWLSVNLHATLLELAEAGHYTEVRTIFVKPLRSCPELLLCGLAQCTPRWDAMRNELYGELLPLFFGSGAKLSRPVVMRRLWSIDRNLVLAVAAQDFARVGFEAVRTTAFQLAEDLEDGVQTMLEVDDPEFALAFACVAAARGKVDFKQWLSRHIDLPNFAMASISYVREHLESSSAGDAAGDAEAPLSLESLQTFLACIAGSKVRAAFCLARSC